MHWEKGIDVMQGNVTIQENVIKQLDNYIGGSWQDAGNAAYTAVTNPANGEEIAQVRLSTSDDVDQAVEVAKVAQKEWALVPAPKRADYLYAIGRIMIEKKEHLTQVLTEKWVK